jgi:3'-5' exoribonuclease
MRPGVPEREDAPVPRINIEDMQVGQVADQVFLLTRREIRTARNNTLYLSAELADRTGTISAKMWNLTEPAAKRLPEAGPVRVRGRVDSYQGANQLLIDNIQFVQLTDEQAEELLPHSRRDTGEMFAELVEILSAVQHPDLRALLDAFLADEELMAKFRRAPAAMRLHHAYLGGLLEHTLSVARLAVDALGRYEIVNIELLLTGILLHDLGKVEELAYDASLAYSQRGNLVGHLVIGLDYLDRKVRQIEAERERPFPRRLRMCLEHLILAHHGAHEFGSPKLPMTGEAIALHYLDNLDAKLTAFGAEVAADPDPAAAFTQPSPMFKRRLYKLDPLGDEDDAPPQDQ